MMNKPQISRGSVAIMLSCILLGGTLGYLIGTNYIQELLHHRDPEIYVNLEFTLWDETGILTSSRSGNLLLNTGARHVRNFLGFVNQTNVACRYFSLGNGTPSATMSKLTEATTGNLSRRDADTVVAWMNGTKWAYNATVLFTGSTNYISVQSCMLHWDGTSDSSDNGLCVAYLTNGAYQQFGVATQARLRWIITIS